MSRRSTLQVWSLLLCLGTQPKAAGQTIPSYLIQAFAGTDAVPPNPVTSALIDIRGIAIDAGGTLYLADTGDHRVHRLAASGAMSVVAGTGQAGFQGDGGSATQALLNLPYGVAVDTSGNVYIADLGNGRVRRVGSDGKITTIAGGGARRADVNGLKATDALLVAPRNLAVDPSGVLYISDFGDHRVYRLSLDGRLFLVAGSGTPGFGGDGGFAVLGQLNAPAGLAFDQTGTLYICDSANHAIRRVRNGLLSTVSIPTGASFINLPTGVAIDSSGTLYIASSGFDQLVRVTAQGPQAVLQGAKDVVLDGAGNVYAVSGSTIRKRTPDGQTSTLTGTQTGTLSDAMPPGQTVLLSPTDVKFDAAGSLYVLESGAARIRKLSSGLLATVAGDGAAGFAGDGGSPLAARFLAPQAIALDAGGNLFVADTGNHRIRRIPPGGIIQTVAGTGTAGYDGDGRAGTQSQLNAPCGIAADSKGNLYIADTGNHRIRRLSPSGILTTFAGDGTAGLSGLSFPKGLAFDALDNLYIADTGNNRIRMVTVAGVLTTIAASGLSSPAALAVDGSGGIWITDTGNQRIRRFAPDGGITTLAGTGQRGFSGDGGAALSAQLADPSGIAIESATGAVYLADRGNQRVRKLVLTPSGGQTTIRVLHAAALSDTTVAPGMLLMLTGAGVGLAIPALGKLTAAGTLDTALGDLQVTFDGQPAPLLSAQDSVITLQAPYRLSGRTSTVLQLLRSGIVRAQATLPVVEAVPALFTNSAGSGPAAAINEDGATNSALTPAARGSIVSFFATGEGSVLPAGIDGKISDFPYPSPSLPLSVSIGGQVADSLFVGSSIGAPGLLQVTVRMPASIGTGQQTVQLTVGNVVSSNGVILYVK